MVEIFTEKITIKTKGFCDPIDITSIVQSLIKKEGFKEGNAIIFINGATAGVTTIEYEPGLIKDIKEFFEKIIPEKGYYYHNNTWHDGNGFSHIRASILKPSLTVPFKDSRLLLGTWQQIIVVDFDNRSRNRSVIIQIIGVK